MDTEPIYDIRIVFEEDGSMPVNYYNLKLISAAEMLIEWSDRWVLIPTKCSQLYDNYILTFKAKKRTGLKDEE